MRRRALGLAAFGWIAAAACGRPGDVDPGPSSPDAPSPDGVAEASADPLRTRCPAGSRLRHARTSCSGPPLVAPEGLAASIATAEPGDVVSMNGMKEVDAPCVPVLVCTPDDAPTLLFSDSPEMPSADGVLYADSVPAGRYRFYVYHANGGAAPRKFPVVALNEGSAAATLTILRRGVAGPSLDYVSAGKAALRDWLADRAPTDVVVPPGQRVLIDAAQGALVAAKDELVHAIYDVVTDAPLKVSVVSITADGDATIATAGMPLLARDIDHQRGTFPQADVIVVATPDASRTGVQRLRLGRDEVDATLEGRDAPTGDPQRLRGNYGMLYRLVLDVPGAHAGISPRGGAWGGVAQIGSRAVALPDDAPSLDSSADAIALAPVSSNAELRLLSAGGANLPIDLFVVSR